jgi:hypothetical protein
LLGPAGKDEDPAVRARKPILAEKVLIVRDEEEPARTAIDLWIGGVSPESTLRLLLSNLAEPTYSGQPLCDVGPDVVIEEDERRLARLPGLSGRHTYAVFTVRSEATCTAPKMSSLSAAPAWRWMTTSVPCRRAICRASSTASAFDSVSRVARALPSAWTAHFRPRGTTCCCLAIDRLHHSCELYGPRHEPSTTGARASVNRVPLANQPARTAGAASWLGAEGAAVHLLEGLAEELDLDAVGVAEVERVGDPAVGAEVGDAVLLQATLELLERLW